MSGVIVAGAAVAAIGAGTAAYSGHQARKAEKSARGRLDALEYNISPEYTEAQDSLKNFGLSGMKGEFPDYYKAIGESGSSEFEKMLGLTSRDIQNSALSAMAASGRSRGGQMPAALAGTMADTATKLRYEDYARALQGKQYLLGTSLAATEDVRNSAGGIDANKNSLDQMKASGQINLDMFRAQQKSKEMAAYGSALSSAIGSYAGGASGGGGGGGMLSQLMQMFQNKNQGNGTNLTGNGRTGSISSPNGFISSTDVGGD